LIGTIFFDLHVRTSSLPTSPPGRPFSGLGLRTRQLWIRFFPLSPGFQSNSIPFINGVMTCGQAVSPCLFASDLVIPVGVTRPLLLARFSSIDVFFRILRVPFPPAPSPLLFSSYTPPVLSIAISCPLRINSDK